MINPTWGLSILLIVYFFKIALTYTFYICKLRHLKHIVMCIITFCGVCSLVVLAVLARTLILWKRDCRSSNKNCTVVCYQWTNFMDIRGDKPPPPPPPPLQKKRKTGGRKCAGDRTLKPKIDKNPLCIAMPNSPRFKQTILTS